ncbi:MAG: cupin domain-containing protein [Evtepia sp.]|uniref:cupin domain-containing protein n=1 Tax=Evtepia sp. TaxID=2773933 RepID=UPI002A761277|nr:cupin domain-containing protein [Evtepia sp.]MDY3013907.1 cupin domain-containing protein [Evtepia sp.]
MLLAFDTIPEEIVPHMRDGEGEVHLRKFSDPLMKVMNGTLPVGATIGMHTHETNSEVIYILSGRGKVLCDGVYEPLEPGSCHYCPKGHGHSLMNDGEEPLRFLAIVPEH